MNAVELMASTSVGLIRVGSVHSTGKELMDASHFCDSTRDSEVGYVVIQVYKIMQDTLIYWVNAPGREETLNRQIKLNSVGECALTFNLPLVNIETVYFRLIIPV